MLNLAFAFTCVLLCTVRVQCRGVTLVPIYGHPTEKFNARDTYTHAGAKQQCARYNLTLAKRDQPSPGYNDNCIKRFGKKILRLSGINHQFMWLGDCKMNACSYLYNLQPDSTHIYDRTDKNYRTSSSLALCQGKTVSSTYPPHYVNRFDLAYSGIRATVDETGTILNCTCCWYAVRHYCVAGNLDHDLDSP